MFTISVTDHVALIVHVYLLGGDVLATVAVGLGILWESEALITRHKMARAFVLWGVVLETLCSVGLFAFDEGISGAQQSKIIALTTELDGYRKPRFLNDARKDAIARAIKPYPPIPFFAMTEPEAEPWDFVMDISAALKADGWDWQSFPGQGLQAINGRPKEGITILDHIEIQAPPSLEAVAKALGNAIKDPHVIGMEDVRFVIDPRVTTMTIIVGSKK